MSLEHKKWNDGAPKTGPRAHSLKTILLQNRPFVSSRTVAGKNEVYITTVETLFFSIWGLHGVYPFQTYGVYPFPFFFPRKWYTP